ncbi:MAG: response regulator transcription factor [Campylobacterota bacterium]|nr:response regulator transcription factor [Campylobacterota bacterium]
MKKTQILLVEDDEIAASLLHDFLTDCGFVVDVVFTVTDGISHIKQNGYSLVILDLNLPDYSGLELLKTIKNHISLPIIITSAYGDTQTKVKAFKYGASDYMVKPIDLEELEVRIWSLLGRYSEIKTNEDKNIFEIKNNYIVFNNNQLELTTIEFEILSILIKHKNQTISRQDLASSLSKISSERSLDHHIKNIRKKIKDDGKNSKYLKTEYGVGYKLVY